MAKCQREETSAALATSIFRRDNDAMELQGHVRNGMIVLQPGIQLPEGAAVTVHFPDNATTRNPPKGRVQIPLIVSDKPGSVMLTGKRIAEIMDEDDASF